MVTVVAVYANPNEAASHLAWANDFAATLSRGDTAAYVNFLGDESAARVRAAYPGATWERLRAIKTRYDPTNLFRLNQNIPPAKGDGETD
jgi:FAD/FMN-containing dehydrogenase